MNKKTFQGQRCWSQKGELKRILGLIDHLLYPYSHEEGGLITKEEMELLNEAKVLVLKILYSYHKRTERLRKELLGDA